MDQKANRVAIWWRPTSLNNNVINWIVELHNENVWLSLSGAKYNNIRVERLSSQFVYGDSEALFCDDYLIWKNDCPRWLKWNIKSTSIITESTFSHVFNTSNEMYVRSQPLKYSWAECVDRGNRCGFSLLSHFHVEAESGSRPQRGFRI